MEVNFYCNKTQRMSALGQYSNALKLINSELLYNKFFFLQKYDTASNIIKSILCMKNNILKNINFWVITGVKIDIIK